MRHPLLALQRLPYRYSVRRVVVNFWRTHEASRLPIASALPPNARRGETPESLPVPADVQERRPRAVEVVHVTEPEQDFRPLEPERVELRDALVRHPVVEANDVAEPDGVGREPVLGADAEALTTVRLWSVRSRCPRTTRRDRRSSMDSSRVHCHTRPASPEHR